MQFIIFLDATIVNVALPSIRDSLRLSEQQLTWVVNGYLLAASGLLLVGGRLGDVFGRRKLFAVGAGLFAAASVLAAVSVNAETLLTARFVQGVAEACAAPAALGMIALTFTDPREAQKAFAIWGGLSGLGATLGVVLSGVLTDLISWRWIFWINLPLALVPLVLVFVYGRESTMDGRRAVGPVGAILVTGGMVATVHGILQITAHPVASADVALPLIGGLAALAAFVVLQAKSAHPLMPLSFLRNRVRAAGYLGLSLLNAATAAMFFLLVLYMQNVLGYSPLANGLAWVPYCLMFLLGLRAGLTAMSKLGARAVITAGLGIAALGMGWLALVPVDGDFWTSLLPGMVVLGFGGGVTFPAVQTAALSSLSMQDAGLGSGIITTLGQLGQAVGLTALVTVSLAVTAGSDAGGDQAVVDGYGIGLAIGACVLLAGAIATRATFGTVNRDVAKLA
ncbi:MFS transporter [Streptomyces sp. NPDC088147]|uniref:MFS transporter n=1 Tax=unclassified Streptomyces TaxID=2593676 RepID=UPI00365832C6